MRFSITLARNARSKTWCDTTWPIERLSVEVRAVEHGWQHEHSPTTLIREIDGPPEDYRTARR